MFDPHRPLTWCALLALALGCDANNQDQSTDTSTDAPFTRLDGPAYVASLTAGFIALPANAHEPITLDLARHRPGRSDLWLQGRALGSNPKPWGLARHTLEVPLAGAMVHGLHEMVLVTAQYPNFSRSAPVYFAITPARSAELSLVASPQQPRPDREISRLLYPGQGTLYGAPLAWIYKDPPAGQAQLALLANAGSKARPILLPGEVPDLTQTLSVAIFANADAIEVLALFLDDPQTLWHWRIQGEQRSLAKIALPSPAPGYQGGLYRIGVDRSGVWIAGWEGLSAQYQQARPGDRRLYRLDTDSKELVPISPSMFGQSAIRADLRLEGVIKAVSPDHSTTQLNVTMDSWNPKSGPPALDPSTLFRWSNAHRPPLAQRCATLSPLLDEIWVGLDAQSKLVAGATSGAKHLDLELQDPGSPGLALGPQPLDCGVHQGRFLAVRAQKDGSPLQILHFDGALMHEQRSDVSCQDAALSGVGEQSRLWCLRDGSLFPMTLQWQHPKANADQ